MRPLTENDRIFDHIDPRLLVINLPSDIARFPLVVNFYTVQLWGGTKLHNMAHIV